MRRPVIGLRPSVIASGPSLASSRRQAVLDAIPGRTATELARDAGKALPNLSGELFEAATAFNDVTYGDRPGTESAYRMIAGLDDHLRFRTQAPTEAAAAQAPTDGWAEVR